MANHTVGTAEELYQALAQGGEITVNGELAGLQAFTLPAGSVLKSSGGAALKFKAGQPGISLAAGTRLENLRVETDAALIAVGLEDAYADLGQIAVSGVTTVGRFHLEAAQALRADIALRAIHVEQADARMAAHRPAGFGVEVLLGAVSVYNFSKNPASRWQLTAENLSCGSKAQPVRGSGVYVFGGDYIPTDADLSAAPAPTQAGGKIEVAILSTGEIHADGGIAAGTPNLITGGVFLGSGAHAAKVENLGSVTTYGINDMVLDNWGSCDHWLAKQNITSFNTSGIGFVNFGDLQDLQILAPIETHGIGARGFNLYDGKLQSAVFQSITTYGNGAIGIQLSKPFGSITVNENITTKGGEGESLVRGKIVHLKAHGISLKPGTQGEALVVKGAVQAEGAGIPAYEFVAAPDVIARFEVGGKTPQA